MSEAERETSVQVQQTSGSSGWFDLLCRIAAFGLWAAFVTFFLGLAVNRGLMIADDGQFAVIAKCMACGIGYASTSPSLDRLPPEPLKFDPTVGTGPAIILPCAAVLKLAGISDAMPGISAILVWGGCISLLLFLIGRQVRGITLLLGTGVFCLANLSVFTKYWFMWHSLLGEVPAAAYLLLGHWLLADERFSRRSSFFAGVLLCLAVQTKYLAAVLCPGAFVMLAIRVWAVKWDWRARMGRVGIFLLGYVAPTALWEAYKLRCLGFHSYLVNWQQFIEATRTWTVREPKPFSFGLLQQRFNLLISDFYLNLIVWAVIVAAALYLFRKGLTQRWPCLLVGITVSTACAFVYWACFSMGWQRYAVMAVVVACFALSLPVFGLPRLRQQAVFAVIAVLALNWAISSIPMGWRSYDYALFRPGKCREARAHVVAAIEALKRQGPIDLVCCSQWVYYDVDFNLDSCVNFNCKLPDDPQPGAYGAAPRRIALINKLLGPYCYTSLAANERDKTEILLGEKIVSVLFSEDPFELVETRASPPAAGNPPPKPAGEFLSATPNPAPPGTGCGSSMITWDTGDGTPGELTVAMRGDAEQTLTSGAHGSFNAPFLAPGFAYEFRLYAGPGRKRLLDSLRVTRDSQ